MRCPVCLDSELVPKHRAGVEVDHCPRCRGMWLDRGELDNLLDLAEARAPEPASTPQAGDSHRGDRYPNGRGAKSEDDVSSDDKKSKHKKSKDKKKKRKGAFAELLEDVFDAFD